jgi:hypothetical protein
VVYRVSWWLKIVILVICLAGCELYGTVGGDNGNIPGALPYLLQGEWFFYSYGNPSDGYKITNTELWYDDDGLGGMNYHGNIRFVSNYSSGAGVIIIEYLAGGYPTYTMNGGHNGNAFFAVYYRNLKADSVQLANATTLPLNTCPDTATLEEAIAQFTRMKAGNYVNWGTVQTQRRIK